MKKVYIAHPLRGNMVDNLAETTGICKQLAEEKEVVPFSPLHNFSYLNAEKYDAVQGMKMCFSLLECADELWVYGEWWKSEGCQAEICFAGCRGIPIRFMEVVNG